MKRWSSSTTVVLPAPLAPTSATRRPGSSVSRRPSSTRARTSSNAIRIGGAGRRRGHGGIGDRRLAIEQLEHPLARRAHAAQVARRRRQRLDGLERGERQQREHGDEHAIEVGGGEREDAGHGGARDRDADAVGQPARQRVAAGDRDERPVGGADPAQRGIAGAVDDELGRAAEQLDELDRQLGAGGGVAPPVSRLQAVGEQRDRDAAGEQAAGEHDGGGGQERGGDADRDGGAPGRDQRRDQHARMEVLQRVDVGDGAREQVAVGIGLEPRRRQRLDPLVHARAHVRERAQRDVVARQPLEVAGERACEAEEAHGRRSRS